jgi:hypothetical protein
MLVSLRKSASFFLAWYLAVVPAAQSQQPLPPPPAPVPPQILSAHTVFISNGGGGNYFNMFTGGPDRAYDTFYADVQQASRYQLVSSPSQADLIFEIRGIAPAVRNGDGIAYNPQLILSIIDPHTSTVLWTTSANVRALGTQKRRDQGFDQSVDVLVDKLGEITGQPLTPLQSKAVRSNSSVPTSTKVFIFVGIAALAGLSAYGAYRITHPPSLPQPTLPSIP